MDVADAWSLLVSSLRPSLALETSEVWLQVIGQLLFLWRIAPSFLSPQCDAEACW